MNKIFNMLKLNKKQKGSFTVEATLIFPLIMFIMFAIVYLTIIHYQNNVMIAESIRAMNRAGAYWQYIDMDSDGNIITYNESNIPAPFDNQIESNKIISNDMIKKRNAYRTILDTVSGGKITLFGIPINQKKVNAKEYVDSQIAGVKFKMHRNNALEEKNKIIWATGTNGKEQSNASMFFGNNLKISIGRAYLNPLLGLSKLFFKSSDNNVMKNIMQKDIIVSGVISNQVEFVRNIDTVYDIGTNLYKLS